MVRLGFFSDLIFLLIVLIYFKPIVFRGLSAIMLVMMPPVRMVNIEKISQIIAIYV